MNTFVRAAARPHVMSGFADWLIVGLLVLAIVMLAVVSAPLLTEYKIHYVSTGGRFFEKLHPATYAVFLAFGVLLLRNGNPIGEIDRIVTSAKSLLVFLFCWSLLFVQCVVLHRPFTGIIDTFLLPVILSVVVWNLTPENKKPLVWAVHCLIWLNIAVGYYEHFSGHRLVVLTVGGVPVNGEWRSTAFLASPLAASSVVGLYVLALVLRPDLCRPLWLRVPAILVSLGSLAIAFGGRTALLSVLAIIACIATARVFRVAFGRRVSLPAVMLTICGLFLVSVTVLALYEYGVFDKMLMRFSSDKGSAHARLQSLHLLTLLGWKELILGTDPDRGTSLQSMTGLQYGIEDFWIACIVQYGVISTALITLGMGCFFFEVLRRSVSAAGIAVLFVTIDAASSVSFSSKNITLTLLVTLMVTLLPSRPMRRVARAAYGRGHHAHPRLSPIVAH